MALATRFIQRRLKQTPRLGSIDCEAWYHIGQTLNSQLVGHRLVSSNPSSFMTRRAIVLPFSVFSRVSRRHSSSFGQDAPLPELPTAPRYPCPFLTDEEITTYLLPLYFRGWTVQPSEINGENKPAPELVKEFSFKDNIHLSKFVLKTSELIKAENHHPTFKLSPDRLTTTIKVHTHSGLRPASQLGERRKDRVQPGITLRDVRYAYLLEGICEGARLQEVERSDIRAQPTSSGAIEARRYCATK